MDCYTTNTFRKSVQQGEKQQDNNSPELRGNLELVWVGVRQVVFVSSLCYDHAIGNLFSPFVILTAASFHLVESCCGSQSRVLS